MPVDSGNSGPKASAKMNYPLASLLPPDACRSPVIRCNLCHFDVNTLNVEDSPLMKRDHVTLIHLITPCRKNAAVVSSTSG